MSRNATIPDCNTVTVPPGFTFVIPSGVTLTVNGTFRVDTLTIEEGGALINNSFNTTIVLYISTIKGEVTNNGTYEAGAIAGPGILNCGPRSRTNIKGPAPSTLSGITRVKVGAKVDFGATTTFPVGSLLETDPGSTVSIAAGATANFLSSAININGGLVTPISSIINAVASVVANVEAAMDRAAAAAGTPATLPPVITVPIPVGEL